MHEGGTASAVPPSLVLRPSGVEPLAGGGGEAVQLADALAYGELDLEGEAKKEISSGAGEGEIIVRVDPRNVPRKGDTVWVSIRAGELHCFSASTGERLNP